MKHIRRFLVVAAVVLAVNVPVVASANEVCEAINAELHKYGWNGNLCWSEPSNSSTP